MLKTLYSPENVRLTSWLKQKREEQGLTIRELAEILNAPHSLVGKVEQGERRLDVVEYVHYCQALGVKPEDGLKVIAAI